MNDKHTADGYERVTNPEPRPEHIPAFAQDRHRLKELAQRHDDVLAELADMRRQRDKALEEVRHVRGLLDYTRELLVEVAR